MELPELPGLTFVEDVSVADWVVERLKPWGPSGARVESFLPEGFDAYARIEHPLVRWSSGHEHGRADSLPEETFRSLRSVLRGHTKTARGYLCVWVGYGAWTPGARATLTAVRPDGPDAKGLRIGSRVILGPIALLRRRRDEARALHLTDAIPKVRIPHREYYAFAGALDHPGTSLDPDRFHAPNLWWPEDRAWCVATEIYGAATYVGGSRACVDEVLRTQPAATETSVDSRME